MSRYIRIAIVFLTAALFYGCDNEIEIPTDPKVFSNPSRELDGKYDVVSLISEKPVDQKDLIEVFLSRFAITYV